ncbi:MAG: CoA transferase subunit A [Arcobacter sp.]|jgi:acetate CoA/acetoacetate CoA-transferase alpha subunit|uniref:CoA transferase subunit A n=1 Tax=unclassified Arcobacter TaxID=2593671 RepID=UPI0002295BCC|nr:MULTISPECIES: CoA transferase subunit A [unclassified Arcobacter]MDY3200932.1 CoA transferase subunit A [Arcobacter sp.]BAK71990.1 putative 3-oxoacid CoA-transferase alpha subunit [Arcobacter sp. L]
MGKVIEMSEIGKFLKDGMTISIGGFLGCGNAHNIIDEILKTDVKGLILVSSDTVRDGQGIGKLIADNRISKLMATHIGTNKDTQRQVNEGLIELELIPQGTLAERLRSAAAGLGGVLTRTGLGTLVQEGKEVINIDGKDYILEKPIHLDLAIVKAQKADKSGNLIYNGATRNFNVPMAGAAKVTIAEVEEIVENGELNPNFIHTPFVYINHIVKA